MEWTIEIIVCSFYLFWSAVKNSAVPFEDAYIKIKKYALAEYEKRMRAQYGNPFNNDYNLSDVSDLDDGDGRIALLNADINDLAGTGATI